MIVSCKPGHGYPAPIGKISSLSANFNPIRLEISVKLFTFVRNYITNIANSYHYET